MSELTTRQDVELWREIFSEYRQDVAAKVGYNVDVSLLLKNPADVPEEARQAVKDFEAALLAHVIELAEYNITKWQRVLAEATIKEAQRALDWAQVSTFDDLRAVVPQLLPFDDADSQGRMMRVFLGTYMESVEGSGADLDELVEGLSRSPKMAEALARTVARVVKSDLSTVDKNEAIRQAVSDAATLPSAAEMKRVHLNGHSVVPCEWLRLPDGTMFFGALPKDDDAVGALAKVVSNISGDWGNAQTLLEFAYQLWKGTK